MGEIVMLKDRKTLIYYNPFIMQVSAFLEKISMGYRSGVLREATAFLQKYNVLSSKEKNSKKLVKKIVQYFDFFRKIFVNTPLRQFDFYRPIFQHSQINYSVLFFPVA